MIPYTKGEEGLKYKRGLRKLDNEVDELERLRRENIRLKRQLKERDMVVELLKKVKELERMWGLENNAMSQSIWQLNIFIITKGGALNGCVRT